MPDTLRQQIITAVDAKLKTILVTGGYYTNLGQNVKEWDETPLAVSEAFRVEYRDEEELRQDLVVGEQDIMLPLTIRVLAAGSTSPATLRKMLADVAKAMHADPTWGGLASDTVQDGAAVVEKAEAADIAAGTQVKYRVEYSLDRGAS
jgi:hypothetical protein